MGKRPDKTAQTKADFKEAFWRLYSSRPMEKITVRHVCELAGYNRGTFYLHFRDLYDVLETIEDDDEFDRIADIFDDELSDVFYDED